MITHHNLYIGDASAEIIKIDVGATMQELETAPADITVRGRNLLTGKPKEVFVKYIQI
jgi:rod shape-determining protein MreB